VYLLSESRNGCHSVPQVRSLRSSWLWLLSPSPRLCDTFMNGILIVQRTWIVIFSIGWILLSWPRQGWRRLSGTIRNSRFDWISQKNFFVKNCFRPMSLPSKGNPKQRRPARLTSPSVPLKCLRTHSWMLDIIEDSSKLIILLKCRIRPGKVGRWTGVCCACYTERHEYLMGLQPKLTTSTFPRIRHSSF
jgi:hypothetical protein